jgi:hypothetical protein
MPQSTTRDYSILTGFWSGSRGALVVSCWPPPARTEETARCGPGAHRPAPPAGLTAMAPWPPPERVPARRPATRPACPRGGHQASRDQPCPRTRPAWRHRAGGKGVCSPLDGL